MLLLAFDAATARDVAAIAKRQAQLFLREMKVRGREEARREMKVTRRANNSPIVVDFSCRRFLCLLTERGESEIRRVRGVSVRGDRENEGME
ncbi:hypothetical protein Dimus_035614 [Dionaea muscipula]